MVRCTDSYPPGTLCCVPTLAPLGSCLEKKDPRSSVASRRTHQWKERKIVFFVSLSFDCFEKLSFDAEERAVIQIQALTIAENLGRLIHRVARVTLSINPLVLRFSKMSIHTMCMGAALLRGRVRLSLSLSLFAKPSKNRL